MRPGYRIRGNRSLGLERLAIVNGIAGYLHRFPFLSHNTPLVSLFYPHNFRSSARYWMASAACAIPMSCAPWRSATVRSNFSILSYFYLDPRCLKLLGHLVQIVHPKVDHKLLRRVAKVRG